MAKAKYKLSEIKDLNVYKESYTRDELLSMRRTLAKTANQRLVRLERGVSPITGKTYDKMEAGAYAEALSYMNAIGGTKGEKPRFKESYTQKGKGQAELRREITMLQGFLNMKSSTVKGWREIENKRTKTFIGMGLAPEVVKSKKFYEFLSSQAFKDLSNIFDSDDIVEFFQKDDLNEDQAAKVMDAFTNYVSDPTQEEHSYKDLVNIFNAAIVE